MMTLLAQLQIRILIVVRAGYWFQNIPLQALFLLLECKPKDKLCQSVHKDYDKKWQYQTIERTLVMSIIMDKLTSRRLDLL